MFVLTPRIRAPYPQVSIWLFGDGMAFDLFGRRRSASEREAASSGRLPPGQRLTEGWPVLQYGSVPKVDLSSWTFRCIGLVEEELSLSWEEFMNLPQTTVHCDIHCVTHWSKLDNDFTGVAVAEILSRTKPKPEAQFVMVHALGDYTTNLSLQDISGPDCLLAHSHNGEPLTPQHGWPVRLLVPKLYLWKSAKWLRGFEFIGKDRPGFWETYGYHMHGDPWKEERYS
jgi:DMSO/TMAO reductase YedYZ molybdopterin-dependent catalytic subunit